MLKKKFSNSKMQNKSYVLYLSESSTHYLETPWLAYFMFPRRNKCLSRIFKHHTHNQDYIFICQNSSDELSLYTVFCICHKIRFYKILGLLNFILSWSRIYICSLQKRKIIGRYTLQAEVLQSTFVNLQRLIVYPVQF